MRLQPPSDLHVLYNKAEKSLASIQSLARPPTAIKAAVHPFKDRFCALVAIFLVQAQSSFKHCISMPIARFRLFPADVEGPAGW